MKALTLSFIAITQASAPSYSLLGLEELVQEAEAQKEASLSSGYAPRLEWESFDEWRCFPRKNTFLAYDSVNYGKRKKMIPLIHVLDHPFNHDFTLPPHLPYDYEQTFDKWNKLIYTAEHVCFFAAKLPRLNHGSEDELWYVTEIKTELGEWLEDFELDF